MDDLTLERLNKTSSLPEKIRDKIELAVWIRLEEMAIYPEMTKSCAKYWVLHSPDKAGSNIWNTANMIWMWAGDTSKDHNYYTKRALLSSVIISTTLYWLNDSSEHKEKTKTFLNRRINNVLKFGQFIGRPVSSILKAASFLKARNCQAREKQNNEN
jgi:ubiquinone biosynthesis protein COQ9